MTDLQIASETIEPLQVKLTIVVPDDRIEAAMTDVAQLYARRLKIRGYRPGHVPLRLVLAQVPGDELRTDAIERLTEQVTSEAVRAEKLQPGAPITVRRTSDAPLTFEAVVPLRPEIELGDYRALRLPETEPEPVTDEEIDAAIEQWRNDMAYKAPVARPAGEGDFVAMRIVATREDEDVVPEQEMELQLTGDGATAANLPTAIVEQLVGIAGGEDRSFALKYPEFWPQSELQGQDVSFQVHASGVSAMELPDLDDNLAREITDVESLDELRDRVRGQIDLRKGIEHENAQVEAAVDALVEQASVRYPPALLESEVAGIIADLKTRVERQGFTWERWLELQQKDEDALWDEIEPQARQRLERALVLGAFAHAEDIQVGREEVDREVGRMVDMIGEQRARRPIPRAALKQSTASRLRTSRTLQRLIEVVTGAAASSNDPEVAGDGDQAGR